MTKIKTYIPGLLVALFIAALATFIESILPIHLIGASLIALFTGLVLNYFIALPAMLKPGLKFSSKRILRFAIILLGASLSVSTILEVGQFSLIVMVFTLFTCFGGGYISGKFLGLNWKLSNLISAGTGICGGSAIAAIAPTIDADDKDIAYAMSATFLFDMAMILLFPIMGEMLGLSDIAYGLWSGTAINDTSSVVAAGYAYSEGAGDFATMVKLTRTLSIIPTVIIFSFVSAHVKRKENPNEKRKKLQISEIIPWFIVGFIFMSILNSVGFIPLTLSELMKEFSKFLMVVALAAIGLNTSFKEMKQSGINPMIHGFIISAAVVIVAFLVEVAMGLI